MGVQDREYMDRPFSEIDDEGVFAATREDAERLLHFSCPTQAANGKWYRTSLAVTNVPVFELFNVMSQTNFAAQRLREIAKTVGGENQRLIEREATKIESLKDLLKRGMGGGVSPFAGANIHQSRQCPECFGRGPGRCPACNTTRVKETCSDCGKNLSEEERGQSRCELCSQYPSASQSP